MKKAIISLSILIGIVLAFVLNLYILENILIPDPCYYHSHNTNAVFDIFYDLPASEGYHPFPTIFNFIFTTVIGAMIGWAFSIYIKKKQNKK
jgi:uncharacterized membrane protein YgaE (UPF0421/DUF939 family)